MSHTNEATHPTYVESADKGGLDAVHDIKTAEFIQLVEQHEIDGSHLNRYIDHAQNKAQSLHHPDGLDAAQEAKLNFHQTMLEEREEYGIDNPAVASAVAQEAISEDPELLNRYQTIAQEFAMGNTPTVDEVKAKQAAKDSPEPAKETELEI